MTPVVRHVILTACAFVAAAGAAPAAASPPAQTAAGVYWTPERMLATVRAATATQAEDPAQAATATTGVHTASARRAPATGQQAVQPGILEKFPQPTGQEWKKGGLVARTTGKLFFKKNGKDNHCSGVVVDTRTSSSAGNLSTVLTAAHCLYSRKSGDLSTMVSFVPGYTSSILNPRPYGTFDAVRLMPSPSYISADGPRYLHDYGFVIVRKNQSGSGQLLQDAVNGALEFSPPGGTIDGGKVWTFGYPSNIKGGVRLVYCAGRARESRDRDLDVIDCDMKEGASGGPLLLDFDSDTGKGKVVSVRAVGDRNADIAGFPRLGILAAELFESARTVPVP